MLRSDMEGLRGLGLDMGGNLAGLAEAIGFGAVPVLLRLEGLVRGLDGPEMLSWLQTAQVSQDGHIPAPVARSAAHGAARVHGVLLQTWPQ